MSVALIQSDRPIVVRLKTPGGKNHDQTITPGLNQIPTDVWGAMLAKADSEGRSIVGAYLEEGILRDVSPQEASGNIAQPVPKILGQDKKGNRDLVKQRLRKSSEGMPLPPINATVYEVDGEELVEAR